MSDRKHGTRAKYVTDRCRCADCRQANADAERNRSRQTAYGRWAPYVDAYPARQHVRSLMAQGMGWKRIADVAGVSRATVNLLLYGARTRNNRPPSRRIRPANAAALLAVRVDLADGALVPAQGTRRRIQALVCIGYSQAVLAKRLGTTPASLSWTLLKSSMVEKRSAEAVKVLYDELSMTPFVPVTKSEKISASRAKRHADWLMWVPPLAWDDDSIDDPFAEPEAVEHIPHTQLPVDEIAVQRAMDGDRSVVLSKADRYEVARRWIATGRSHIQLEKTLGIHAHRYTDIQETA